MPRRELSSRSNSVTRPISRLPGLTRSADAAAELARPRHASSFTLVRAAIRKLQSLPHSMGTQHSSRTARPSEIWLTSENRMS